ncbi:transposable element Tcb2 transposase [Trichonephila clavipes]|nr:transposable element Tcb2 transposase [Trichonephila clavipes]
MDKVEKLAYQLNEKAERTERPIRRLTVKITPSCCLSEKWQNNQSVRRHLDAFTRGRIIGKLEEGRSGTSVAAEFELLTASFHDFGDNFKLQEQLSGGSVVVVHEEPHLQMTGILSYRPEETGGKQREKSLDTRHRRLDDRYRVLPWPEDCTVVVCLHDALYDESRFSLSSDSHHILIWRQRGSRNPPSNIIERDRYGGRGVLVWGGIMLGSRTDLHIFDAGSVNGTRYCYEILLPYVRLFRGTMGLQFLFMDDNAPCHHTVAAEQLLESEDIERMDWPARSLDLNSIEHVWDFLVRRLAARTLPPVTIRELRLALQDEWAAMPQQLIDTLILSMGRRCETCLADVEYAYLDNVPYAIAKRRAHYNLHLHKVSACAPVPLLNRSSLFYLEKQITNRNIKQDLCSQSVTFSANHHKTALRNLPKWDHACQLIMVVNSPLWWSSSKVTEDPPFRRADAHEICLGLKSFRWCDIEVRRSKC